MTDVFCWRDSSFGHDVGLEEEEKLEGRRRSHLEGILGPHRWAVLGMTVDGPYLRESDKAT